MAEDTPGPVPALITLSPRVTPVWKPTLGITGECAQGNHQFNYGGCWAGIVMGNTFLLKQGRFWTIPCTLRCVCIPQPWICTNPVQSKSILSTEPEDDFIQRKWIGRF